ncbi:hypothetical protein [Streptomyces sp. NPDC093223]|uniref:hypothetical protein n=1 Tax=Streptomyces sp. NPDC093223 TaxID=3366033 RepID=UPI00380D1FC8
MRVGRSEEFHLGDFTTDLLDDVAVLTYGRPQLAALLRAAADAIEHAGQSDEEVPRAVAHE